MNKIWVGVGRSPDERRNEAIKLAKILETLCNNNDHPNPQELKKVSIALFNAEFSAPDFEEEHMHFLQLAKSSLETVLKLQPEDHEAMFELGWVHYQICNDDFFETDEDFDAECRAALKYFKTVKEKAPDIYNTYNCDMVEKVLRNMSPDGRAQEESLMIGKDSKNATESPKIDDRDSKKAMESPGEETKKAMKELAEIDIDSKKATENLIEDEIITEVRLNQACKAAESEHAQDPSNPDIMMKLINALKKQSEFYRAHFAHGSMSSTTTGKALSINGY